jgi:hypothetical protein
MGTIRRSEVEGVRVHLAVIDTRLTDGSVYINLALHNIHYLMILANVMNKLV